MNLKYLRNFKYQKPPLKKGLDIKISNKQKVSLGVLAICVCYTGLFAQYGSSSSPMLPLKDVKSIITGVPGGGLANISTFYLTSFSFLDIVKYIINYIIQAQVAGTQTIANSTFGNTQMFSRITNVLTILACIGCAIKIGKHYLKTERYDNVPAFTGFFSYFGILVLFLFSDTLVTKLVSVNSSINTSAVSNIGNKINAELDEQIALDYENLVSQLKTLETEYISLTTDGGSLLDSGTIIRNRTDFYGKQAAFYAGNIGKYAYFSFFGVLITAVLAIPVFVMTLMVKILLSVMILGTKLVFLTSFIPGFENTWKTFMLNLVHILLWIPIFNSIIAFILSIISATMVTGSMTGGQIVWLSIVAIICAYQAVSLTTSAAGVLINGAGASIAGGLGSLSGMNAMSMSGKAISTGASIGAGVATGGSSTALQVASKLKK